MLPLVYTDWGIKWEKEQRELEKKNNRVIKRDQWLLAVYENEKSAD